MLLFNHQETLLVNPNPKFVLLPIFLKLQSFFKDFIK